ncbi:MAG: hypothetical protein RLZZ211_1054 [Bacteroidota bacterium]|jgi:NAD(P)-dependent dehydrogenase (short-subunit alcohol dehydrogenase family)
MMKKILITGASGGIGHRIASSLLLKGYSLVLHGFNSCEKLKPLQDQFPDLVQIIKADLSVNSGIETLIEQGRDCSAILHCAGIPSAGISWKVSKEEFVKVNQVNYFAPFFISQGIIPAMRNNKWGRIIFFSSIVAQTGVPGTVAYASSKSALFGLTRTIAAELATSGITVNCIAPGYMDEGMIREIPKPMSEQIIANTPIKKLSDTSGIVGLVELLLSDDANSITGQVLSVNGGLYM